MKKVSDRTVLKMRCPKCGADVFVENGKSLICRGDRPHCYDFSSSGYINLASPSQSGGGDSKDAVRARSLFLDKGYYRRVADEIADTVERFASRRTLVIDAGCGEGYYTSFIAQKGFGVLGVDLSKHAVESATKRLRREGREDFLFSVSGVFDIPVKDSSAGAVVNIFAPCAESEFERVLCDGGIAVVAWAGPRHLYGLKSALYENVNINLERADIPVHMEKIYEKEICYNVEIVGNDQIMALFSMTPYYWRTSKEDILKLKELEILNTEIDIVISVFKNDKKEVDVYGE